MNLSKHVDQIGVFLSIIIGKALTFIFDMALVAQYGSGAISDAYIPSYSIPLVLFEG